MTKSPKLPCVQSLFEITNFTVSAEAGVRDVQKVVFEVLPADAENLVHVEVIERLELVQDPSCVAAEKDPPGQRLVYPNFRVDFNQIYTTEVSEAEKTQHNADIDIVLSLKSGGYLRFQVFEAANFL